jgi:hypothetical protein
LPHYVSPTSSAWKSSLGTAKRPGLDWTQTRTGLDPDQDWTGPRPGLDWTQTRTGLDPDQDWTGPRPVKTGNSQDRRRLQLQSSLWSLKILEISRLRKDRS